MTGRHACSALLGFVVGVFAWTPVAVAQPGTASSFDEATKRYQNRTRDAELGYLLDLRETLKKAMATGDLEGAKRIQAVCQQIEKDLKDGSPRIAPAAVEPAAATPPAAADPTPVTDEFVARHVLGDWILENGSGTLMSPVKMDAGAPGQFTLTRATGAQYTVCGTYALQGRRLVKEKRAGDAYWDLTWHSGVGTWVLRRGQYSGWTLRRPER